MILFQGHLFCFYLNGCTYYYYYCIVIVNAISGLFSWCIGKKWEKGCWGGEGGVREKKTGHRAADNNTYKIRFEWWGWERVIGMGGDPINGHSSSLPLLLLFLSDVSS